MKAVQVAFCQKNNSGGCSGHGLCCHYDCGCQAIVWPKFGELWGESYLKVHKLLLGKGRSVSKI